MLTPKEKTPGGHEGTEAEATGSYKLGHEALQKGKKKEYPRRKVGGRPQKKTSKFRSPEGINSKEVGAINIRNTGLKVGKKVGCLGPAVEKKGVLREETKRKREKLQEKDAEEEQLAC